MITVLEVLPVTKNSVINVYRDTETKAFSHWEYEKLDQDPVEVRSYPEHKTIVYDEPIPHAARKVINEYCVRHAVPRRRALYYTAASDYLSQIYDALSEIVSRRAHTTGHDPYILRNLENLAPLKKAYLDKNYRWLLEERDYLAIEQYDDYYQHVMEGK